MRIVQSNQLAVLADDLLDHWPKNATADLSPTSIVVPSLGMARWLTYRIATAFSVCAQVRFVYPATYVWSLFAAVCPELSEQSPFDTAVLTWRLFRVLGALPADLVGTPLQQYLATTSQRDRLALARRLAALYAEILAQRPTWAPQWQKMQLNAAAPAEHERWLAALWRHIAGEIPAASGRHPRDLVLARLKRDPAAREAFPRALTIFAVPQMAPLYQDVFQAFDAYSDVTVYLVNPSAAFWFDLDSDAARASRRSSAQAAFDFDPKGQRLLSALGRQSRENLSLWGAAEGDRNDATHTVESQFVEVEGDLLLSRLQQDIGEAVASEPTLVLDPLDRSIGIHSCHSFARQLEVLHDQLLNLFDASRQQDKRFAPGEVLVLVPDIDRAAPIIDAVFGSAPGSVAIPYVVTGQSAERESPLLNAFFALLAMQEGRFTVNSVIDLLAAGALAARFEIDEPARESILTWMRETGVHWGLDGHSREKLGLPGDGKHTFADGLAALFMGYASAAARATSLEGVMPYGGLEGKSAETLGALTRFVSSLAGLQQRLAAPRTPQQWNVFLNALIEEFFDRQRDEASELSRLESALSSVGASVAASGFGEAVPLNVIIDALRHALADNAPGAVPTGSVTFSSFGPLRQLPYRMIVMLDLNGDGQFPRNPQRPEFDLLARQHRAGDRNLLDEDRAAFLDAVMAAREKLLCFYNGRSMRDNAALPPSSVLDDLVDSLADLIVGGRATLAGTVIIEHPLQPFSARYFQESEETPVFFSYAQELLASAAAERPRLPAFFKHALSAPDERYREVELDLLLRVLHDPVAVLLQERLGMRFWEDDTVLSDNEPVAMAPLDLKRIRDRLFTLFEEGVDAAELERIAAAFPEAPSGIPGEIAAHREILATGQFAAALEEFRPAGLQQRSFSLAHNGFRVFGALSGLTAAGRFDAKLSKLKSKELLRCWLSHLVLHLLESGPHTSTLVCTDTIVTFGPVEQAGERLDDLLNLYWQCLSRPVPLIPEISLAFVQDSLDPKKARSARKNARKSFLGSPRQGFIRAQQRAYRTVYGNPVEDLPPGFEAAAHSLWEPVALLAKTKKLTHAVALADDETASQPF